MPVAGLKLPLISLHHTRHERTLSTLCRKDSYADISALSADTCSGIDRTAISQVCLTFTALNRLHCPPSDMEKAMQAPSASSLHLPAHCVSPSSPIDTCQKQPR